MKGNKKLSPYQNTISRACLSTHHHHGSHLRRGENHNREHAWVSGLRIESHDSLVGSTARVNPEEGAGGKIIAWIKITSELPNFGQWSEPHLITKTRGEMWGNKKTLFLWNEKRGGNPFKKTTTSLAFIILVWERNLCWKEKKKFQKAVSLMNGNVRNPMRVRTFFCKHSPTGMWSFFEEISIGENNVSTNHLANHPPEAIFFIKKIKGFFLDFGA